MNENTATEPRFPDIRVHLTEQLDKPVAMVAMVRRALQKAGHPNAAMEWTERALGASHDEIVPLARAFVTVL